MLVAELRSQSDTAHLKAWYLCERKYVGGYQNYGPFLGTLKKRCRIITGIQKGAIILTTPYVWNALR